MTGRLRTHGGDHTRVRTQTSSCTAYDTRKYRRRMILFPVGVQVPGKPFQRNRKSVPKLNPGHPRVRCAPALCTRHAGKSYYGDRTSGRRMCFRKTVGVFAIHILCEGVCTKQRRAATAQRIWIRSPRRWVRSLCNSTIRFTRVLWWVRGPRTRPKAHVFYEIKNTILNKRLIKVVTGKKKNLKLQRTRKYNVCF